ncbi:MAG: CoA transferase, partial [Acidimicrobiales bacterium]
EDPDELAEAIARRPAAEVEDAVFAAGGIAAAVRTRAEWESHPQGRAVREEALIGHTSGASAAPSSARPGHRPASGVRVLDLTRVIAGPVCTRYLGALGADVLRIDPPGHADMHPGEPSDTLFGKRSAPMDLAVEQGETVRGLLAGADVAVTGYRPGALDRFGLGADALAEDWPGLVIVQLDAWGHSGPWAGRRGFDSVVQAPTGIAIGESADGEMPGALPCQLLDHGTGYLAAGAALDGLYRQRTEGGTHLRRLSLARTAAFLATTWSEGATPGSAGPQERPWVRDHPTADGPIRAVDPPGSIGGSGLRWPGPPARYLADPPTWLR